MNCPFPSLGRSGLVPPRQAAANPCGASSVRLHLTRLGSQCGSQHAQTVSHVLPYPASIAPGERHAGRHWATSGDRMTLIWEQEAAGSNPAIPTRFFECVVSLWKQEATRRQLSPDAGRRGWVAVHAGCAVAPRCRGIRLRPAGRNSVRHIVTRSQAPGRRRAERLRGLFQPITQSGVAGAQPVSTA